MIFLYLSALVGCRKEPPPCGGDACCSEAWQKALVDSDTIFVARDRIVDLAEGVQKTAVGSLEEAIATAGERGASRIAVERGIYEENLVLDDTTNGLSIHGQCREETILDGSSQRRRATVQLDASEEVRISLTDLTVTGGLRGIDVIGGTLVGKRIDVIDNHETGIDARGQSEDQICLGEPPMAGGVALSDSKIAGTRAMSDEEAGGVGVRAICGMAVDLRRVVVEDNQISGFSLQDPTASGAPTAVLEDVDVRDTIRHPDEAAAVVPGGATIGFGAWVQWTGGVIEDVPNSGIGVFDAGTRLDASSLTVRRVEGNGVTLVDGSSTLLNSTFEGNDLNGVQICMRGFPCGASAVIEGGSIVGNGVAGAVGPDVLGGLQIFGSSVLEMRDTEIVGNQGLGVGLEGPAVVSLAAVTIESTHPTEVGGGTGLQAVGGARVELKDTSFVANTDITLKVFDPGTLVTMRGGEIRDTVATVVRREDLGLDPGPSTLTGMGASAAEGGALSLEGVHISRVARVAVFGGDLEDLGTEIIVRGCTIEQVLDGEDGIGMGVSVSAASATVEDTIINSTANTALHATFGARVSVSRTEIAGVVARGGGGAPCVAVSLGSEVDLVDSTLRGCTTFGVVADDPGTLVNLVDTTITELVPEVTIGGSVGLSVTTGATSTVARSTITGAGYGGAWVHDTGSALHLVDSVIEGTAASSPTLQGVAVAGSNGATLTAAGLTLRGNRGVAFQLDRDASAQISDVEIADTLLPAQDFVVAGVGVLISDSALVAEGLTVSGTEGDGIVAIEGATLTCASCVLDNNTGIGAVTLSSILDVDVSEICGNGSAGVLGASDIDEIATLILEDSVVCPHPIAGVQLAGPGRYQILANTLAGMSGMYGPMGPWGNAIFVANGEGAAGPLPWDGSSGLEIADNLLEPGSDAVVVLAGSSGTFSENIWLGGTPDLQQFDCANTVAPTLLGEPRARSRRASAGVEISESADVLIVVAPGLARGERL